MSNEKYSMSFTTGGLFYNESVLLATLYLESEDWDAVKQEVISENYLQARTISSMKRTCREVISRLQTLNHKELNLFVNTHPIEQQKILWLAVCRRFRFIAEFASEVVREHFITLKNRLEYEDFDMYFNRKAEWHDELDKIKPSTFAKLRQVLFKIMREAEILLPGNIITATRLSSELVELISLENRQDLLIFPVYEADLKRMLEGMANG